MTKKDLNKLKKSLPKGYRDTLAEKCDCSLSQVDSVLAGTRKSEQVIKTAISLALLYKAEQDEITNQIKSL